MNSTTVPSHVVRPATPARTVRLVKRDNVFPELDAQALYELRAARLRRSRIVHLVPERISNHSSRDTYDGRHITQGAVRPGADNFLALPSRIGDVLHYRDGHTEVVA